MCLNMNLRSIKIDDGEVAKMNKWIREGEGEGEGEGSLRMPGINCSLQR
jgi:hypothetical protein